MPCVLSDFRLIRPKHEIAQEKTLDWIAQMHVQAAGVASKEEAEDFYEHLRSKLLKLRGGKECIESRGIHIDDLFEKDWEKKEIYPVEQTPHGSGFTARSHFYDREVSHIFERFYPEGQDLPAHLIHVTCTGYVAPSPAQKLISLRRAGKTSIVTHAYHMGCYGSIPAIRIASGFASFPNTAIDIVHTELCSLHMHPLKHSIEQLLVQSLFADGFIKYTLTSTIPHSPHLKILSLHEETIPDSSHCMTWRCEDHGLGMTLSKEVPIKISRALEGYLDCLCMSAGLDRKEVVKSAFFAIHPGGPKILQQIRDLLQLKQCQIEHSVQIFKQFGNMSSATLPHIWDRMLQDAAVPKGAQIVSLAFGPGLNIAGGLFEKEV
jgi:predicted naringenin-chalcone synthase